MTRSRTRKIAVRRVVSVLASRAGKIAVAAAVVVAAAASGVGVALAGAGARPQVPGPVVPVVAPGTRMLPGALAVAEPHAGTGWMDHQFLVRVNRWRGAHATCGTVLRRLADTRSAAAGPVGCGSPELATPAPAGYSPAQLSAYLHLRGTGAGQRVVVVDAFDNPYAGRDITIFSRKFGLPLPCGTAPVEGCFRFSVVHPFGFAGADPGWALESDLDVQMVHAIAPKAAITLVEGFDNQFTSLLEAIDYGAALRPAPAAVSGSWGGAEFAAETSGDRHCALARSVCVFSAGDSGNPGLWPAYDPYALAVGGTHLELAATGKVAAEVGWCCNPFPGAATGGGVSAFVPVPAYQRQVSSYRGRGIPDVSFDADPVTGVPVYDTFGVDGQNGWFELGGTSVGAPAWAGIMAAADQLRAAAGKAPLAGAGFAVQKLLYGMPHRVGLGDITQGIDNLFQCTSPVRACRARTGFDLVSGWGSPRPGIDAALAGR